MNLLPYELRSVTRTAAPADSGGTWFRYVIVQGANEITGMRNGEADEVKIAVREMVEHLNLRSVGKNVAKKKTDTVRTTPATSQLAANAT